MKEEKHSHEIVRVERKDKENKAATLQVKSSGQGLKKTFKMYLTGCKRRVFSILSFWQGDSNIINYLPHNLIGIIFYK